MDNLKRGYAFLIQAWRMARADPDLVKPSVYALFAGLIVTVVFLPLLVLSAILLGDRLLGQVVTGFLGVILLFAQLATGYIFSAMTVYLIFGYLAEGDGRLDRAWEIVRRDWLDILSLAGASTLVGLLKRGVQGRRSSAARNLVGGAVEALWTEAAALVLPAMVIEDVGLIGGLQRVVQIVRDHLLLVSVSLVGVRLVNGLVGFLLGAIGVLCGLGVGLGFASLANLSTFGIAGGIILGVLIASLFILAAVAFSTYTSTAYHTCLYLWAREVERARQEGQPVTQAPAPAPLAAVLTEPVMPVAV